MGDNGRRASAFQKELAKLSRNMLVAAFYEEFNVSQYMLDGANREHPSTSQHVRTEHGLVRSRVRKWFGVPENCPCPTNIFPEMLKRRCWHRASSWACRLRQSAD